MGAARDRSSDGDRWARRLITAAEVLVGGVAVLGIGAWLTLNPILLLLFLFSQPLLLLGVCLFAAGALASDASRRSPAPSSARDPAWSPAGAGRK